MSSFETNHAEEQSLEVEALGAIYVDAFAVTSENPLEWRLRIEPTEAGMGETNHVGADLTCCLPERYPDEPPIVKVETSKGLTPKQGEELQALAETQAQENVGMVMGYTIAECLKEWLVDHNVPSAVDGSMHGEMLRRMAEGDRDRRKDEEVKRAQEKAREEDDEDDETIRRRRQADGTPVTPATFAAWKAEFEAEMQGKESKAVVVKNEKPTGKEMFLSHLAVEGEEDGDDEGGTEDVIVVGNEGAFLEGNEDDDDDLDDLSDGEEDA